MNSVDESAVQTEVPQPAAQRMLSGPANPSMAGVAGMMSEATALLCGEVLHFNHFHVVDPENAKYQLDIRIKKFEAVANEVIARAREGRL